MAWHTPSTTQVVRACMRRCNVQQVACTDGSAFSVQDNAACKLILPMRMVIWLHCLVMRGSAASVPPLPW